MTSRFVSTLLSTLAFSATVSLADLLPPKPEAFNGECYCSISCNEAYASTDPADKSVKMARYIVTYKVKAATETSYDSDERCKEAAEVPTPILGSETAPSALTLKMCLNGTKEFGHCKDSSVCSDYGSNCRSVIPGETL